MESCAATPTITKSSPCSAFSSATAGASLRQAGHHGAQNHSSTSLPTAAASSKGCPSTWLVSSRRISGRVSAAEALSSADDPSVAEAFAPPSAAAGSTLSAADTGSTLSAADAGSTLSAADADSTLSTAAALEGSYVSAVSVGDAVEDMSSLAPQPTSTTRLTAHAATACRADGVTVRMLPLRPRGLGRDRGYIRHGEHPGVDHNGVGHGTSDTRRVRNPGAGAVLRRSVPVWTDDRPGANG